MEGGGIRGGERERETYSQAGAVCVSSNNREAISWFILSTNSESNHSGEVVDNKIL